MRLKRKQQSKSWRGELMVIQIDHDQSISKRLREISESSTIAIGEKANAMKAKGIDIISFAMGEPDFDTPEYIKEAAIKSMRSGFTKYTTVSGITELKKAIREKFERDNNLLYSDSEIIVSCGAKHALYNLSQVLFEDGDEVIVLAPYWVTYPDQIKLAGGKPVIIDTSKNEGFNLSQDELKRSITSRTKALILNSPCNPTGKVFNEGELERIADVCLANNLYIISDEIYEKISYERIKPISIASLGNEVKERTIVVNGVSKTYAMTGWRIGYAAGPQKIISTMNKIQGQITSNPNSIAQMAAAAAISGPQESVTLMREEFQKRRNYIVNELNSIKGMSCSLPGGAFYAFADVSKLFGMRYQNKIIENSIEFCSFLLDGARVAAVPGKAFGADHFIRLSFATGMKNIEIGIGRIKEALNQIR
jgi:aspartate aminotransferase